MGLVRSIAGRFSRLLNSRWTSEQHAAADRAAIGALGERIAARWLQVHGGCRVLYRNFRPGDGGEVDVVCRHGTVLAFVEVKTRTSEARGRPALAVTPEKQALILRGASAWLRLLGFPEIQWRYDIVEVLLTRGSKPDVHWIKAAFNTDEMRRQLAARRRR